MIRFVLFPIVIVSCITSCRPSTTSIRKLDLISSNRPFCSVSIELTNDFDTLHNWIHRSDYNCGDLRKYRFQSSVYPMVEDSFELSDQPDSMYGLTISHRFAPECDKSRMDDLPDSALKKIYTFMKHLKYGKEPRFSIYEITKINGLSFVTYAIIDTTNDQLIKQELKSTVYFKEHFIHFVFTKSSGLFKDTSFIADSYEMLKTVRLQ